MRGPGASERSQCHISAPPFETLFPRSAMSDTDPVIDWAVDLDVTWPPGKVTDAQALMMSWCDAKVTGVLSFRRLEVDAS